MQFYRLIKPNWAKKYLANGSDNADFVKEIPGDDVVEGCDYDFEFLKSKNEDGYNIYFFPNHPSRDVYSEGIRHLNGKIIDTFNFVFVDMDLKDGIYKTKEEFIDTLKSFRLSPSMVVDSGNGVHAYWRVSDLDRDSYVFIQVGLITKFKTDESVFTTLQLMRCPGFLNTKKIDNFREAKSVFPDENQDLIYKVEDFSEEINALSAAGQTKAQNHLDKLDGKMAIKLSGDINIDELPDSFIELIGSEANVYTLFTNPKELYADRSAADMKLANVLFNKNFNIKETLAVISNTQKALEKQGHRYEYAVCTVEKVYNQRIKNKFSSVKDTLKRSNNVVLKDQVKGPYYQDYAVLGNPWRKTELLGLIAGSGVGKTAKALNIVKHIIENNDDNDDIHVFFSLEMPEYSVIDRWVKLVGDNSPLTERLYVIGNYDETGSLRKIGLQEIHEYCQDIVKSTGKKIGSLVIDHLHIISAHIDTRKKPDFNSASLNDTGKGDVKTLGLASVCNQLKTLVMSLGCFGIVLTQTTKSKGIGDIPIGKDGAYGISNYEWIMDRIITIWQPLMRVQHRSDMRFLAWQYVKVREKTEKDQIHENEPKLLTYDLASGRLDLTTSDEYSIFSSLLPEANAAREAETKKKVESYSVQLNVNRVNLNALNRTAKTNVIKIK